MPQFTHRRIPHEILTRMSLKGAECSWIEQARGPPIEGWRSFEHDFGSKLPVQRIKAWMGGPNSHIIRFSMKF